VQLFKSFLLYIPGVLVGVLGTANIYSQANYSSGGQIIFPFHCPLAGWVVCACVYPMKMTQIFEVMRICKENLR